MPRAMSLTPMTALSTTCTSTTSGSIAFSGNTSAFLITAETTDVRMTFGAVAPTSTTGHVIPKGNPPWLLPVNTTQVQFLSNTAGSALIQVTPLQ